MVIARGRLDLTHSETSIRVKFTAVNFTRMLVALWVKRKRPRVLYI